MAADILLVWYALILSPVTTLVGRAPLLAYQAQNTTSARSLRLAQNSRLPILSLVWVVGQLQLALCHGTATSQYRGLAALS